MSKKRKHHCTSVRKPDNRIYFTVPAVRMIKVSLKVMEDVIDKSASELPNMSFALDVIAGLYTKLHDMIQREDWNADTPLDHNEVWVIYTALQLYLINLHLEVPKNETLLEGCSLLCKEFAGMVEAQQNQ